jgi:hypothetical protein
VVAAVLVAQGAVAVVTEMMAKQKPVVRPLKLHPPQDHGHL